MESIGSDLNVSEVENSPIIEDKKIINDEFYIEDDVTNHYQEHDNHLGLEKDLLKPRPSLKEIDETKSGEKKNENGSENYDEIQDDLLVKNSKISLTIDPEN